MMMRMLTKRLLLGALDRAAAVDGMAQRMMAPPRFGRHALLLHGHHNRASPRSWDKPSGLTQLVLVDDASGDGTLTICMPCNANWVTGSMWCFG